MNFDNYDEFGNYIGPEIPGINNEEDEEENNLENSIEEEINNTINTNKKKSNEEIEKSHNDNSNNNDTLSQKSQNSNSEYKIILHEDKNFYPESEEIFPQAENIVMEEDAQPITEPIISPMKKKKFDIYEKEIPQLTFSLEYLNNLLTNPKLIRNISIAGALHHGKTSFINMFIKLNHLHLNNETNDNKYLDNREDEQKRKISIKSSPITLILENSKGKNYLFNFIDTPGHPNFFDEIQTSFKVSDGVLIIVDCVEGITTQTELIIKEAIKEDLDIILVINKIDRLILELKIPPKDAYFKIKYIIDDFNKFIVINEIFNVGKIKNHFVHPNKGNVLFASSEYNICFNLENYVVKYLDYINFDKNLNKNFYLITPEKLAKCFFGDIYFHKKQFEFSKKENKSKKRTFVKFVLEPLYKIIGYTISEEKETLIDFFANLKIKDLKDKDYKMDPKPFLIKILKKVYGLYSSLVDICVNKVVDCQQGSKIKINNLYTGDKNTEIYKQLIQCEKEGPLYISVYKLYHKNTHLSFDLFGRILSGELTKGQSIKILGEHYSLNDKEDQIIIPKIKEIWINQTRYRIPINKIQCGNLILIDGVEISSPKNLTLVNNDNAKIEICKPIKYNYSYMKVSVEPLNPSDLPKMIEGLRKIDRSYPASKIKVEESGENIILGTGELYMDSILYDLRNLYSDIELKVSDPVVTFCETVTETSSFKCKGISNNNKNSIFMTAEPLDSEIILDINQGIIENYEKETPYEINNNNINNIIKNYLINTKNWDKFTTNSIWSFSNSNILLDYTLPNETDKLNLYSIKNEIIQGFDWAIREGPLCNEQILNTKFKILSSSLSTENIYKASGQIIPMSRRVCYSSFLTACPRLMEPYLKGEIQCPIDCFEIIKNFLMRRRGHLESQKSLPGTPFYIIKFSIPALDSFGLETDIRTTTAGQAFSLMWFDKYQNMIGDPLDRNIVLHPLEPSDAKSLAREVLIKTRRRKGLNEDVNIVNYLIPEEIEKIKNDEEYNKYM